MRAELKDLIYKGVFADTQADQKIIKLDEVWFVDTYAELIAGEIFDRLEGDPLAHVFRHLCNRQPLQHRDCG